MATGIEVEEFFTKAGGIVGAAIAHAMKDGTLAAAGRQGIDELGMALKAFPDAIQAQESGTIFNPTQGEIAAARSAGGVHGPSRLPSPSEIAADNRPYQPEPEHGHEHGHDR